MMGPVGLRRSGARAARGALALALAAPLAGCSIIFQGHPVDQRHIAEIRLGVTTEQDVVQLLGAPEAVVHKEAEGVTVYQYKDVTATTVGIPFIISFGRAAQRGRVVNVIMKDGRVVDYERTEMKEPLVP